MSETWRQGARVPHHVYAQCAVDAVNTAAQLRSALAELVRLDGSRAGSSKAAIDAAWSHARAVLADPAPMYPDTKFLTLCTLEGRRVGAVTVGESRLPVVDVLALIRAHGVEEARLMWPQLTDDELAVLGRLVGDLDAQEDDDG